MKLSLPLLYYRDSESINVTRITMSVTAYISGFGGLEVACWPLVPKFAGSYPAEAVGFLGHAFLRRGSKAVGPMS